MSLKKIIAEIGDSVVWMNLAFASHGLAKEQYETRQLLMEDHRGILDLLTDPHRDVSQKLEEITRKAKEFRKNVREFIFPMIYKETHDKYGAKISIRPHTLETEAIRRLRNKMVSTYVLLANDLGYNVTVLSGNGTSNLEINESYACALFKEETGVHKINYSPADFGGSTEKRVFAHISVLVSPINGAEQILAASRPPEKLVRTYHVTKAEDLKIAEPFYARMWERVEPK